MKIFAIIPSGGSGMRMNNPLPKQYLRINGKEIIAYTLEIFQKCDLIDEIIIAAQKNYFDLLQTIKKNYSFSKISKIVEGGEERQHSVFNALKSINAKENDLIVVHDAVRPLLPQDLLKNTIATANQFGCAVAALKAKDTLIKGNDSILSYVDRNEYYYAQTPQIFRYKILFEAMKNAELNQFIGTDESMLVHRLGYEIKIVEGSSLNFKITSQDDIKLLQLIFDHN